MADQPTQKKAKIELFDLPMASTGGSRSLEDIEKAYREAVKSHPFFDNAHAVADVYKDGVLRDGQGNVLGVLVKQGLPEYATQMAADVLRPAATRTSLRANMYGGEAPLSGIAGYFDYRGSPIEHKYRKTAFTYEHEQVWPNVFPMIDYVSEIYKRAMPENWAKQDAAIPDLVRIHGSPFSTLTINSRFRTAHHTDAGDFDGGYGCLACLEGPFVGLALTFDSFRVTFVMQPRDVLIFNTHHFHSNTEPETINDDSWHRLTCVFYYRTALGEAAGYAEYRRRLANALRQGSRPGKALSPILRIVEKPNGENQNRPATVHKLDLTPFALTASVHLLSHCGAAGLLLHDYLLAEGQRVEVALFGEPLYQPSGIPAREEGEMELLQMSPSLFKSPAMGGFKECDLTIQAATEKQRLLEPEYLAEHISMELLEMWQAARSKWLGLVGEEWRKMVARDAQRANFTWNNRSEMNSAFFDLCEVGKQMLLGLLDCDTATPKEEQSFWALFATHLSTACATVVKMPPTAMSVTKLNVKIKDFNFGGTRYFKDMPPEEQKRRRDRKERIEAARRSNTAAGSRHHKGGEWLTDDDFDYQTEDRPVVYEALGHVTPEANALAVVRTPAEILAAVCGGGSGATPSEGPKGSAPPSRALLRILVVLPPDVTACHDDPASSPLTPEQRASGEAERLLGNAAARELLTGPRANAPLPPPKSFVDGKGNTFEVLYAHATTCLDVSGPFDFVVLQHVLCTMPDEALAMAFVERVASVTTGTVFVEESDLQDRQFFRLKPAVRNAYSDVALGCFQELHRAKYGTARAAVRAKADLERLLPSCCVRYKLFGSPLNSTLMMIPGTRR